MFSKKSPTLIPWSEPAPMDAGAPEPAILMGDEGLLVAYRIRDNDTTQPEELFGRILFKTVLQFRFGYPNDEALSGHPLYKSGLQAYSYFKVTESAWIGELQKMNSSHSRDSSDWHSKWLHWIVTFHDETLEVIAKSAEILPPMWGFAASEILKRATSLP